MVAMAAFPAHPEWLTESEARMWRSFLVMHRDIDRAVEVQLREFGLSGADYGILVTLSESPHNAIRIKEIGDTIAWESSRLAHQLRRMEQRGLIERLTCPTDARGTLARLTDLGRQTIEAAAPGHVQKVRECFVELLTPDEIETLTQIADRVHAACAADASTVGASDALSAGARP